MNIPPILLLCIGSTFALAYATIITFGWARTRRNRRKYQDAVGISMVPELSFQNKSLLQTRVKTISLFNNNFEDEMGNLLNPSDYNVFLLKDDSKEYPQVEAGDLVFVSKENGKILYAFAVPDLSYYR